MGGSSSKDKKKASQAPPPQARQAPKRYEPTPEEIERKRREEEESKRWLEEAKRVGPPAPPKPTFRPGGSEDEYKNYMLQKYEYEAWENATILLSRKLRQQAAQQQ
eukprot:TRINITY_DN26857_c0_g1_i1.p1 TRINITY_DN26857_c0_g1~~TRINITY_DN26857_c0_g1_i1.p1  ORF type:complete len:106 (-),score=25.15 TRINITY_DN26857_c0_g1_i1:88-405(-)